MIAIHIYYDGCNGQKQGETYEGSVEEIADVILNLHQNDYATYDYETRKCSPWTQESAVEAIQTALETKQPLILDRFGDGQSSLVLAN